MSEETMKATRAFVAAWAPTSRGAEQVFIKDLAELIQTVGREIILNALRRAE